MSASLSGYVKATPYRLEQEKMAAILQQVVGAVHGLRFYPDISGVVDPAISILSAAGGRTIRGLVFRSSGTKSLARA
jgi:hypothetical protein